MNNEQLFHTLSHASRDMESKVKKASQDLKTVEDATIKISTVAKQKKPTPADVISLQEDLTCAMRALRTIANTDHSSARHLAHNFLEEYATSLNQLGNTLEIDAFPYQSPTERTNGSYRRMFERNLDACGRPHKDDMRPSI